MAKACRSLPPEQGGPPSSSDEAPVALARVKRFNGQAKSQLVTAIQEARVPIAPPVGFTREQLEFAVTTQAKASASGGGGGNKEWRGPSWQFRLGYDGWLSALYNLLGNAELQTPMGRKFVPRPWYKGNGEPVPQRDPLYCAIDNTLSFGKSVERSKREYNRRKYHSDRERQARLRPVDEGDQLDISAFEKPRQLDDTKSRKQEVVANLSLKVAPPANEAVYHGRPWDRDVFDLSVNVWTSLAANGFHHIAPSTMIELVDDDSDMVRVIHHTENAQYHERYLTSDELGECLDNSTDYLTGNDLLDPTLLTVHAAERVFEMNGNGFSAFTREEMDDFMAVRVSKRQVGLAYQPPVEFILDKRGVAHSVVDASSTELRPTIPSVEVDNLRTQHTLVVEQIERQRSLAKTMVPSKPSPTVTAYAEQVSEEVVAEQDSIRYDNYWRKRMGNPSARYQKWLADHAYGQYHDREDQEYELFNIARSIVFLDSVPEVRLEFGYTFTVSPTAAKARKAMVAARKWAARNMPTFVPEQQVGPCVPRKKPRTMDDIDAEKATAEIIADRVSRGFGIHNDTENELLAKQLSHRLSNAPAPINPRLDDVAAMLAKQEGDEGLGQTASGILFVDTQKELVFEQKEILLPNGYRHKVPLTK